MAPAPLPVGAPDSEAEYDEAQTGLIQPVTTQDLLDLEPEMMLQQYKERLNDQERGILFFGFSDQALLDILDYEFEVDMDRNVLIFRKTYLNSSSVRLAAGHGPGIAAVLDTEAESLVEHLSSWLFEATRSLYREELGDDRTEDIRQEYKICLRGYAQRYAEADPNHDPSDILHNLFASAKAMKAFIHSMTVDAMFKADAAKVIFGEQSGYYQAWFRKEIFRNMMAQCAEKYIVSAAA
jgi:hypothetical protein